MPILPVFSRTTRPSPSFCRLFLISFEKETIVESFFFIGITAALIGERWGFNANTTLFLSFSRFSSLYASFNIANTPLSTPAEGSIT